MHLIRVPVKTQSRANSAFPCALSCLLMPKAGNLPKSGFQLRTINHKVPRMKCLTAALISFGISLTSVLAQRGGAPGVLPEDPYDLAERDGGFDFNFELAPQLPENFTIDSDGELRFDPKTQIIRYLPKTQVELNTDTGTQIFAERATVFLKEKRVLLENQVSIYQGPQLSRAEKASYFWETNKLEVQKLRTGFAPFYLEADQLDSIEKDGKTFFVAKNSGMTTHDLQKPNYWFKAEETTIKPNDRIIFDSMRLQSGDSTLLALPYFSQRFDQEMGFHILPGARSNWGPFVLMRYGMPFLGEVDPDTGIINDPEYIAQWRLDLRARRGVGVGIDIQDTDYNQSSDFGKFSFWATNDLDPSESRTGLSRGFVNEDRYRIDLQQRWNLPSLESHNPSANWYVDANFTYLSDRFVLEDFFIPEFRNDPAPDNAIALVRQTDSSVFTALMRFQINDFYTADTRLPEFTFEQVKRAIFGTNILHEGQTSLGILTEELADFRVRELESELAALPLGDPRRDQIQARLSPFGFTRFHTYQEFSAPLKYRDWLSIVPRIGAGYTDYSSVEGPSSSESRTTFTAAIDASVKWSKSYPNLRIKKWGIDGLVHTVQPYVSFSYVATDDLDPSFPSIDRLIPTTRPRPINVGRFNAIDDIQDWTIARIGVRNLLMTRRDDQSHRWFSWDLYFDAFIEDPEFDRNFSNLYSEIQFSPVPWMRLGLQSQLPVFGEESDFTEINTAMTFMPNKHTEITLSHRYLDSHPILQDSNLINFRMYHRINDTWGIGMRHRWEMEDGTLEEQRYTITRDYGSVAMSFGGFIRDNRIEQEFGVLLGFTLKAFPAVNLPVMVDAN